MTYEFEYMLHLAGCVALGSKPSYPSKLLDWDQVVLYAHEQDVSALVQYALKMYDLGASEVMREHSTVYIRNVAISATLKRIGILNILKQCADEGIDIAVIKGFAIASEYSVPDVRISADTDLYVDEKNEEKALVVFANNGFTYTRRSKMAKDTHLVHPQFGHVELHINLYEEYINTIWNQNINCIQEKYVTVETDDGAYKTLGYTDQLLFVIQHMMKHFIVEGLSLKMILDVGILMNSHNVKIDYKRLWKTLEFRKYETAFMAIFAVLKIYCGFKTKLSNANGDFIDNTNNHEIILEDMEAGGVRGFKYRDNPQDGLYIYNSELLHKRMNNLQYKTYKMMRTFRALPGVLFPLMSHMKTKYVYLTKYPYLYPIACIHRMVTRCTLHFKKRGSTLHLTKTVEQSSINGIRRAEMFRVLKMI